MISVGAVTRDSYSSHAMVLDTVKEITEDDQSPGYEVGDYMLIFKNTYDGEEKGKFRKVTMNAKDKNAPNFFYYIHIDVDLKAE